MKMDFWKRTYFFKII